MKGMPGSTAAIEEEMCDEIERMFVDEEETPQSIAQITGVSYPSVRRILIKRGYRLKAMSQSRRERGDAPALSEKQYEEVKSVKRADLITSKVAAEKMSLDLREVNLAWGCRSYTEYLKLH